MHQDFLDLLRAFIDRSVRFLVVGAYALAVHGRPRATGDLDVWVDATPENAARVMSALEQFGAPTTQVSSADFSRPGIVLQMGLPPVRIDVLTDSQWEGDRIISRASSSRPGTWRGRCR